MTCFVSKPSRNNLVELYITSTERPRRKVDPNVILRTKQWFLSAILNTLKFQPFQTLTDHHPTSAHNCERSELSSPFKRIMTSTELALITLHTDADLHPTSAHSEWSELQSPFKRTEITTQRAHTAGEASLNHPSSAHTTVSVLGCVSGVCVGLDCGVLPLGAAALLLMFFWTICTLRLYNNSNHWFAVLPQKKKMELCSSHQAVLPHIGTNNNGRHLLPPESVTIVHPSYIHDLWPQATTHTKYMVMRYTRNVARQPDTIRWSSGYYTHNTNTPAR